MPPHAHPVPHHLRPAGRGLPPPDPPAPHLQHRHGTGQADRRRHHRHQRHQRLRPGDRRLQLHQGRSRRLRRPGHRRPGQDTGL